MRIATLGPKATFSDLATREVGKAYAHTEILYASSIDEVFEQLTTKKVDLGVVPIENVLAGFVQPVLDGLLKHSCSIIQELILPVQFACVAHARTLEDIQELYVQPVAKGQCEAFIRSLGEIKIIQTSSNIDSYHCYEKGEKGSAAIVPSHIRESLPTPPMLLIPQVTDYSHNQTRFVVLSLTKNEIHSLGSQKTSVIIRDDSDHSGVLRDIASALAKRKVNMTSIISRPTRETMGKYYFFIDLEGNAHDAGVQAALEEISQSYSVQLLGSYAKAQSPESGLSIKD